MAYIKNILVSVDQLGNTIAGGNPDNTISSRIGHYCTDKKKSRWYWRALESIIDFSFYPIDGKNHCKVSFQIDSDEKFDKGTRNWAVALLTIIIISSCTIICPTLYFLWLLKVVRPRKIDAMRIGIQKLELGFGKAKWATTKLQKEGYLESKYKDLLIEGLDQSFQIAAEALDLEVDQQFSADDPNKKTV